MTKFSVDRFPAGFFNLSQDIVRSLPVDLIERWTHSDQTVETALALLDSYRVECAVVCTDSAGLTRLSCMRGLIEMLALINHPKELVHAWGTAAGGAAVGVWAADNTQMFYPSSTPASAVLSMLLSLMSDVASSSEVLIGAAVHWGHFFLLAGGLYGSDAELVERLAEDFAGPGEVLVTPEFSSVLGDGHPFQLAPRGGLPVDAGAVCRLEGGPCAEGLAPKDIVYPVPYSAAFYSDLKACCHKAASAADFEALHRRYCQKRAVVLIEREREDNEIAELAVLNDLALSAAMVHLATDLLHDTGGSVTKIAGPLGIFTFPECSAALDFARRFRGAFLDQGLRSRIGIDVGEVVVFDLEGGLIDVAGMPVNLASKMAQDRGEFGRIYLTEAAVQSCPTRDGFSPISLHFGELNIDAWFE